MFYFIIFVFLVNSVNFVSGSTEGAEDESRQEERVQITLSSLQGLLSDARVIRAEINRLQRSTAESKEAATATLELVRGEKSSIDTTASALSDTFASMARDLRAQQSSISAQATTLTAQSQSIADTQRAMGVLTGQLASASADLQSTTATITTAVKSHVDAQIRTATDTLNAAQTTFASAQSQCEQSRDALTQAQQYLSRQVDAFRAEREQWVVDQDTDLRAREAENRRSTSEADRLALDREALNRTETHRLVLDQQKAQAALAVQTQKDILDLEILAEKKKRLAGHTALASVNGNQDEMDEIKLALKLKRLLATQAEADALVDSEFLRARAQEDLRGMSYLESLQKAHPDLYKELERAQERKKDKARDELKKEHEDKYSIKARETERERRDRDRDAREHEAKMLAAKFDRIGGLFKMTGNGFMDLLGDKKRIAILCSLIVGTVGGIKLLSLGLRLMERTLKQPPLVRETSHKGFVKNIIEQVFPRKHYTKVPSLDDLIVSPSLKDKLKRLGRMIVHARRYKSPLPGVLLYGDPGNGKTMFMRALAAESGMNFALISGGDVSALLSSGGKNVAVTEIHKLFKWAIHNGPTLLFVDEAVSLFRKGRGGALSEGLSAVQDVILSYTGGSSPHVMLVAATNDPNKFAEPILSRLSVKIKFPAPGRPERREMYKEFLNKISTEGIGNVHIPVHITDEVRTPEFIEYVLNSTEGFSGRDMTMKFFDSVQREILSEDRLVVDAQVIRFVLDEHKQDAHEFATTKDAE